MVNQLNRILLYIRNHKYLWFVLLAAFAFTGPRIYVYLAVKDRIYSDAGRIGTCKVAMVLGTQALPGQVPSPKLASRCDKAVELYRAGKAEKLLVSGDGRECSNNETETMKAYIVRQGVPGKDVAMDPLGMRTYDSVYRIKHLYKADKIVIVTQGFHTARSLYLADSVGLDAEALSAEWRGEFRDQVREFPACINALLDVYLLHPRPSTAKPDIK